MNYKIYDIDYQINNLLSNFTNENTGEIDPAIFQEIEHLMEEKKIALEDALESLALEYQNEIALSEMYKQEKLRIDNKQKRANLRAETLKQAISVYFDQLDEKKMITKNAGVQLSWRNSTSVEITDAERIPDEFKVPQEVKIDKTMLRDALKNGEVEGAELRTNRNIQIK